MLDEKIKNKVLAAQRNEITEYIIYEKLAEIMKDAHNKELLKKISEEELKHYHFWKGETGVEIKPCQFRVWKYYLIARILGITFGIKLMEKGEEGAGINYREIAKFVPEAEKIAEEEEAHERELVSLIDEEKLKYVGSIVLGLNDALVELTGALAGFTLALQNTRLIATTGLVTGIAASLSMAASEYLSTKSENESKNPLKASIYTGFTYIITVLFLIFPYLILSNFYLCLGWALANAIMVILIFTFYVSVVQEISFKKRFLEMASISLGVAGLSFIIGFLVRKFLNVGI